MRMVKARECACALPNVDRAIGLLTQGAHDENLVEALRRQDNQPFGHAVTCVNGLDLLASW